MRRLFRALVCAGGLAALIIPSAGAAQAQARTGSAAAVCKVAAARPTATTKTIKAVGARAGCAKKAVVRIQLKRAVPGPDKVVRTAKGIVQNAKFSTSARCTTTPRTYYVTVIDNFGHAARSKPVKLRCAPAKPKQPIAKTPKQPVGKTVGTAVEEEVVRLTNDARVKNGCKALVHDPKLHAAALAHSKDMSARNYFDHNTPDGKDPGARIAAAGFAPIHAWGENIAAGQPTATAVVQAWLNSPGHRANIMNCGFTRIGVGEAKGRDGRPVWTQDFGTH